MKNMKRVLVLVVAFCAMMCITAFAADNTIKTIDLLDSNVTVSGYKDSTNFTLTYNNATDGGYYMVVVLREKTGVITESDVLYINQVTANGNTATFDGLDKIYPKEIEADESYIYLSGAGLSGLTHVGTIVPNAAAAPTGLKGDVDLDGDVDADDVTKLLRHVSKIEYITDPVGLANGEVTGDTSLDSNDVTKLLRFVSKIITSLD